jgi:mannose-1-phosphate guanylyltransferase
MRALLLAAGMGTRLRPLTNTIPKCLVPIRGKPLLGYWFDLLFQGGIERALVNTHYLPEQVRDYVGASSWREKVELAYESELLGTGGTVLANKDFLQNQSFLLAHADNLARFDAGAFLNRHRQRPAGTDITMMTFDTDAPQSCGIVEEDARGIVTGFHEKVQNPPGTRANAAVYICELSVVDFIARLNKPKPDISLDVIPAYVGRICTFHNTGYLRDIGTPESLAKAERDF